MYWKQRKKSQNRSPSAGYFQRQTWSLKYDIIIVGWACDVLFNFYDLGRQVDPTFVHLKLILFSLLQNQTVLPLCKQKTCAQPNGPTV